MTTTEKIAQERLDMHYKGRFLITIEKANEELEQLKQSPNDIQDKEIEIHLLWQRYKEL